MPPPKARPRPKQATPTAEYRKIATQFAEAKRRKELEDAARDRTDVGTNVEQQQQPDTSAQERQRQALEARRKTAYERRWGWTVGFWVWMLCIHAIGIAYFTSGFLLTRLVLDESSRCGVSPLNSTSSSDGVLPDWPGRGTVKGGCWHPKTFDRAVVILVDALRYDFTVPVDDGAEFHDALPFLYETAVKRPRSAFLRPFIADPPTSTLQRLKGLTTGTLPTFIDLGSNFAGTAIEEDNLLAQLRDQGKRIVHLGDDTWQALFPDYFVGNLSRAYDSFNVWDLHTVDNGVLEHIFPLMKPERKGEWDVLIGHFLGVDHAGHRYGPAHPAMREKLQQMDRFIRDLAETIDDDTLLIVMGDHGMDSKGDHGGESDDEIEAALWMYSSRSVFGRTQPEYAVPPASAKIRPVNQIDLVPTLALLLGIPIPYNNLGAPIEEAFAGPNGNAWADLAAAARVTAAGIKRYQASYFAARGIEQDDKPGSPLALYKKAEQIATGDKKGKLHESAYKAYMSYQEETLRIYKSLWARFDIPSMIIGLSIMACAVIVLLVYVSGDEDDDIAVLEDIELDLAEMKLEAEGVGAGSDTPSYQAYNQNLVKAALVGAVPGAGVGLLLAVFTKAHDYRLAAATAALASMAMVTSALPKKGILSLLPTSPWGWLAVLFTVSQSVGFASNSYTIWEDSILLFFLTTFGFANIIAAFNLSSKADRFLAIYHSVLFVILGRLASFSKLCREEQMPYCTSTYYASATSSTSAPWQLAIPFAVFAILPSIIKAYYLPTRSYEGLAPTWIGYVLRTGLFMSAVYWTLDSADNGNWVPGIAEGSLKTARTSIAQLVLGLAFVAGTTGFIWAPPCVSILTSASTAGRAQITVLGYGNANGARYLLLPINIVGACILLSKPMGGGAIALMMWQVLSLVELLDLNAITGEAIGPVMLGLLGNYHFFKTGHQAALSSIQWDSAFVPLSTIRYPWSPAAVALNTFAGQILAVAAVPLVVLWKTGPKRKGALEGVSRALGALVAYFAVEALASMAWAGWLRRHLMLYRVFNPRFMMAAIVLLVVDVVGIAVALTGVRSNTLAISEVFGWAD
ncbi:GPI ethanolamine phosphate transferase 3 [Pleurostoma richardsiae]|uniref:GPI ethanolamine phosphate transferase 3 n=1 Tax=Pleurostoma richardsiae TaxID=41990 RepID=A0AA38VY66_9PEZI|nr:GPI ethanolamine phosphate transferase 3 [Pleurostoma richardsiae]